jgi:hypothetical protein
MQTAKKINFQQNTPTNHQQHSARLQDILLSKSYQKSNNIVDVKDTDIPIETRLQAEMELEQALIKMFGYQ